MNSSEHQPDSDRRRHGRLCGIELKNSLGEIVNISAGGMVVLGKNVPRYRIEVAFGDRRNPVRILAERVWSRRVGLFKQITGYRFIDPPKHFLSRIYGTELTTRTNRVI